MATVSTPSGFSTFENGDRMSRAEFHRIYETMPGDFRAELVGGIDYVASPLKRRHGTFHVQLSGVLAAYEAHTPGVEAVDNATVLLGDEGEPQPDLLLRILPEFGGRSRTTADDYVEGAPEFVTEVAASSRAIDLHGKLDDYRRYGVAEYLVVCLEEGELRWFDLLRNQELSIDSDGVLRVRTFPGLWIDSGALFRKHHTQLMDELEKGLATTEHADFVKQLAAARSPSGS
jgi:Uma2 family endonuclease